MPNTAPHDESTQLTTGAQLDGNEVFHAIDDPTGTPGSAGISIDAVAERAIDILSLPIIVAASDETTDLTTGTAKTTFRIPYDFKLTDVRASVTTAPVGSTIIVDINVDGVSILSTKLTIDASQKTSVTAAVAAVISNTLLDEDSEITIDIDQIGSSTAGTGLKIALIGTQTTII